MKLHQELIFFLIIMMSYDSDVVVKNFLLILLVLIAVIMIVLGIRANSLPPALTGIGFIVISAMLYKRY